MKNLLTTFSLVLLGTALSAQYCTPSANCSAGDHIDDLTFNTLVRNNSGGSNCLTNGYIKASETTSVQQGSKYFLSVKGGRTGFNRVGIGVWIDFNRDNDFGDPGEYVYASPRAATSTFTDSILIPFSASTGTTRMRVRCLRGNTITSTQSCTNFNLGETEDFDITITAAPIPPITEFEGTPTTTCDGKVQFTDLTPNNVTSWLWEFGDGDTSTLQNPQHTYTTGGTYTVKLTATNNFGSKAETKTNYITFNAGSVPRNASCTPSTSSSASGFGISNFKYGSINESSSDASEGYLNNSCVQTDITVGKPYTLEVSANAPASQNYRVWIDLNDDGVFTSSELMVSEDKRNSVSSQVIIPPGTVVNKPLRLRVAAVYFLNAPVGSQYNACARLQNGQMEDYGITVKPNPDPPIAAFSSNVTTTCDGTVQFNDESVNVPINWSWDFGDGNSSSQQNPQHTYSSDGSYTVKLTVANGNGADSVTKSQLITVDKGSVVKSACVPNTISHREDYGINTFIFRSINSLTSDGRVGYEDFSCEKQATVDAGATYQVEVKTGSLNKEDVQIWIDFNDDGSFDNSTEKVFTSLSKNIHQGSVQIAPTAVKGKSLRMRVQSDAVGQNLGPCDRPNSGQVEDYGIKVNTGGSNPNAPSAAFTASETESCKGLIQFTDQSTNSPNQWLWEFGDGNSDTTQNPNHQYLIEGIYTVKLTATNTAGADVEEKIALIDYNSKYCKTIGLEEVTEMTAFSFFPNPVIDDLTIRYQAPGVQKLDFAIMALNGHILFLESIDGENTGEIQLDLSALNPGVYLFRATSEDGIYTKKLVIE